MSGDPETVTISFDRAHRMWVFLNELADYGYRFGLPDEVMELIGDCLNGEDTKQSSWGIGKDRPLGHAVVVLLPETTP